MLKVLGSAVLLTASLVVVLDAFGTGLATLDEQTAWFGSDALFLEVPASALVGFSCAFAVWVTAVSRILIQIR